MSKSSIEVCPEHIQFVLGRTREEGEQVIDQVSFKVQLSLDRYGFRATVMTLHRCFQDCLEESNAPGELLQRSSLLLGSNFHAKTNDPKTKPGKAYRLVGTNVRDSLKGMGLDPLALAFLIRYCLVKVMDRVPMDDLNTERASFDFQLDAILEEARQIRSKHEPLSERAVT